MLSLYVKALNKALHELKLQQRTITLFLLNWLERSPEYKSRDFYITGESYGRHFIPQLAELIFDRNKGTNVINLNGFIVIDGCVLNAF